MFRTHKDMSIWEARVWRLFFALCALAVTIASIWFIIRLDDNVHILVAHAEKADVLVQKGTTFVDMANEKAPQVMEHVTGVTSKFYEASDQIVQDVRTTTAAASSASEQFTLISQLLGGAVKEGDPGDIAYAVSVLDLIDKTDAKIGTKRFGKIRSALSGTDWVASQRNESAALVMFRHVSKKVYLKEICATWVGTSYYIKVDDSKPIKLVDWLKANHPETKSLYETDTAKAE